MAVYRYGKKTSDINVQSDFSVKDLNNDAYIKNRPDSTLSISLDGTTQEKQYNPNTGDEIINIDLTDVLEDQDNKLEDRIESLQVPSIGGEDSYISQISENDGKISATAIKTSSTIVNDSKVAVNSIAVSSAISTEVTNRNTAISTAINNLNVAEVGESGSYIKTIKENNGVITATSQTFDTSLSNTSTDLNAPSSKAVYNAVKTVQNNLGTHISDGSKHVPANGTTNSGKFLKSTGAAGSYEWSELENIVVLSATSSQTPISDTRYYIGTASLTTTINKSSRVGLMITVIANVATTIKYPNNSGTVQTKVMEAGTVLPLFSCGSGYTPNLYGLVLDINPDSVSNGQIYIKTK